MAKENPGEAKRKKNQREKKRKNKKREQNPSQNNITLTKQGNLVFQRAHIIKSPLRAKLGAYKVSSTSKNPLSLSFQGILIYLS